MVGIRYQARGTARQPGAGRRTLPPWRCTRPTAATWTQRRCYCAARARHSGEPAGWKDGGWRSAGKASAWTGPWRRSSTDPGTRVFVVFYDVWENEEKELDNWDGVTFGYYRKAKVRVETLDGDVLAWLHVLNFYEGGLPSASRRASWPTSPRRQAPRPAAWRRYASGPAPSAATPPRSPTRPGAEPTRAAVYHALRAGRPPRGSARERGQRRWLSGSRCTSAAPASP